MVAWQRSPERKFQFQVAAMNNDEWNKLPDLAQCFLHRCSLYFNATSRDIEILPKDAPSEGVNLFPNVTHKYVNSDEPTLPVSSKDRGLYERHR